MSKNWNVGHRFELTGHISGPVILFGGERGSSSVFKTTNSANSSPAVRERKSVMEKIFHGPEDEREFFLHDVHVPQQLGNWANIHQLIFKTFSIFPKPTP